MSDEEDEAKRAHELITALRNDGYDVDERLEEFSADDVVDLEEPPE